MSQKTDKRQQAKWEKRYIDKKTAWDRGEASPALEKTLSKLPKPPSKVLVPACGRGYEVVSFAALGFDVTGVDFAPSAIHDLKHRLSHRNLVATLVDTYLFVWEPNESFDVIYEQTALCALTPDLWSEYARRLHHWLRPGGVLVGMFMQTNRDGGPPWHVSLTALQDLFPEALWSWSDNLNEIINHPSGLQERFITLKRRD